MFVGVIKIHWVVLIKTVCFNSDNKKMLQVTIGLI